MRSPFDLQGHRGARGLKPENTLPSFESAFDSGVTSVETDVHLTRDGTPVLLHDAFITAQTCRARPGSPVVEPTHQPLVHSLTLAELRHYSADRNPDPGRFPQQTNDVTPLARLFAEQHGIDPYAPPTLADLFAFTAAYAGELGTRAGKTPDQRARAEGVRFDLELKRMPYRPELIGDGFDGSGPALLENLIVAAARAAGVVERTTVRSFDHRSVQMIKRLEPRLTGAVLVDGTAPVAPDELTWQAGASICCPDYQFIDEALVRRCHAGGVRVVPWTVNQPEDWQRLVGWSVDGITTDYPDRLAEWLRDRRVAF